MALTDDENDAIRARDLLEKKGISCAIAMRSDNYLFWPNILNDGVPLLGGKYVIQVPPDDVDRSLTIMDGEQSGEGDAEREAGDSPGLQQWKSRLLARSAQLPPGSPPGCCSQE